MRAACGRTARASARGTVMSKTPLRIAIINDDTAFLELMQDLLEDGEGY